MSTTHFTTDHENAACGRNSDRRGVSAVVGGSMRLSTVAYFVCCGACERTKSYKAQKAIEDAKKAAANAGKPSFAKDDKIKGYGSTATVVSGGVEKMDIVWADGKRSVCIDVTATRPDGSFAFTKIS